MVESSLAWIVVGKRIASEERRATEQENVETNADVAGQKARSTSIRKYPVTSGGIR
jgi:hypothetical protein